MNQVLTSCQELQDLPHLPLLDPLQYYWNPRPLYFLSPPLLAVFHSLVRPILRLHSVCTRRGLYGASPTRCFSLAKFNLFIVLLPLPFHRCTTPPTIIPPLSLTLRLLSFRRVRLRLPVSSIILLLCRYRPRTSTSIISFTLQLICRRAVTLRPLLAAKF